MGNQLKLVLGSLQLHSVNLLVGAVDLVIGVSQITVSHIRVQPRDNVFMGKDARTTISGNVFVSISVLLVPTHVVCERLSVMQRRARLREFLAQNSLSAPTKVFEKCGVQSLPLL